MKIRLAQEKDIPKIIDLLQQVLEIHAKIRPDIFISGTTKYTTEEVKELISDEDKPIYVAVDDKDEVLGYAMCQIKQTPQDSNNIRDFKYMYIDDLCVDENVRGQHVGETIFEYVKNEAKNQGFHDLSLNVWTGNDGAEHFYEKMGMKTQSRHMEIIL